MKEASDKEMIQSVLALIGAPCCWICVFSCGNCGDCAITGYPPKPEKCRDESWIRAALHLETEASQ
ncbi:MAG: hypothetical protein LUH03_09800 [Oscillospiraceae bacterium]|nr:hypothetical protein [Oscillospiraceae bacterium]